MKLACSDNWVNTIYGLFVALTSLWYLVCISVSYTLILKTVLGIASNKGHLEVLNTCISHICAVLIFCVPRVTLAALHSFAKMSAQLLGPS